MLGWETGLGSQSSSCDGFEEKPEIKVIVDLELPPSMLGLQKKKFPAS
jgi:hypothetical protein